jgi:hypothetical protein
MATLEDEQAAHDADHRAMNKSTNSVVTRGGFTGAGAEASPGTEPMRRITKETKSVPMARNITKETKRKPKD